MTREYLGISEIADRLNLSRETVKAYARDGHLPEADVVVGRVRGWDAAAIDRWHANRPGRGYWGNPGTRKGTGRAKAASA